VRFRDGRPQVIGGWDVMGSAVSGGSTSRIVGIGVFDYFGTQIAVYGTEAKLFSSTSDITPAAMSGSNEFWSFGQWGQDTLLAVPRAGIASGGRPIYRYSPSGIATQIAQAPAQVLSMLVTPERQLLALGCSEVGGTFNSRCIRGSDLEDLTSWTPASTNNAFEHILDGRGAIVAARPIGTYVAIWTMHELWIGQFVGDPAQTYRFDKVSEHCGLVAPNAVTVIDGTAYWVGPDLQWRIWAPGTLPAVLRCPIRADMADNVHRAFLRRIIVFAHPTWDEVWCFYPDVRDGAVAGAYLPSRYVAFSRQEGAWFRGGFGRDAVLDSSARPDGMSSEASFLAASAKQPYQHDYGHTARGAALSWHIQSGDQYVDGGRRRVMVRDIEPDFENQIGDVALTLEVRDRPQSAAAIKGPHTLTTSTTRKAFRAAGRIMNVKFSGGAASGSSMRLGKPTFDCVTLGER
jgi:hypothetical protein